MLTCGRCDKVIARDLAQFLYYFEIAYAASMKLHNSSPEILLSERQQFLNSFPSILRAEVSKHSLDRLFHEEFNDRELVLAKLSSEAPVTLSFVGWGTSLTAAALLTGGEVSLADNAIHAEIRSLAHATAKLMSACGLHASPKAEPKKPRSRTLHGYHPTSSREPVMHGH